MIVVDTNVIAYLLIDGDKTRDAEALYRDDPNWLAPELWQEEFLNVLVTVTRRGVMNVIEAMALWDRAVTFMTPYERTVDRRLALRIAVDLGLSAYDAQYCALAQQLNARLITEDSQLRSAASFAMTIREYLDLPPSQIEV